MITDFSVVPISSVTHCLRRALRLFAAPFLIFLSLSGILLVGLRLVEQTWQSRRFGDFNKLGETIMQAITRLSVFTSFALLLTATVGSSAMACDGYRSSYSYSHYPPVQTYSYSGYGCGTRTFVQRTITPATRITPGPATTPAPAFAPAPLAPAPSATSVPSQVNVTPAPAPNPNQATLRDVSQIGNPAPVASPNPNQSTPRF